MNSYTVSNLSPDTDYSILLCLRRNSHKIPISVLEVVTRPESYMHQLGIVTDYAAIIAGTDNVQCRGNIINFLLWNCQKSSSFLRNRSGPGGSQGGA